MHSRILTLDGKDVTLDFGHEGVLYKNSFIMYDKRTNSKWNHSTGFAMKGPLAGKELNTIPSRMMRWENWKKQHPNSEVLIGRQRGGFMGTYIADGRSDVLGLSVGMGQTPTLYPFSQLENKPVVNDSAGFRKIVVTFDPGSKQAQVFLRSLNDRTLTFEAVSSTDGPPKMKDRETGTTWSRISGKAIEGELKGKQLQSTVGVTWRTDRWRDIYQDGQVYGR